MNDSPKEVPDVLFRNGTIVDGTGAPSFVGDVAVQGDSIVLVRPSRTGKDRCCAKEEIDCTGLVLTPGFIDIHNHSDVAIFLSPASENYVSQGVTTVLAGHCGSSGAPIDLEGEGPDLLFKGDFIPSWRSFAGYLSALDGLAKAINIGSLVGHGQVRGKVMGLDDRGPSDDELVLMKADVREAMEAGAFGLSTGLIYSPGIYAKTSEVVELAKVAGEYGGLYATHLRSEADLEIDAIMEAVQIARESGCRLQIAHLKVSGKRNWGLLKTSLDVMEYARRVGVEVTCDIYPFIFQGQSVFALLPAWARDGGKKRAVELLKDPAVRKKIQREFQRPSLEWENDMFNAGFEGLSIQHSNRFPQYLGKSLAQVARERGQDPMETYFSLTEADIDMRLIAGGLNVEDLKYGLRHRLSMVASDSPVLRFGEGCPHPRGYSTFTTAIATYVRDDPTLTLEQAVHKMTGFPAWKMGLAGRGVIRPGSIADIAVFDYWRLGTKSDFGDPHHYSEGVIHVLVNGQFVKKDEAFTEVMPGRTLRRCGR